MRKFSAFNDENGYRGMQCSCGYSSTKGDAPIDLENLNRHKCINVNEAGGHSLMKKKIQDETFYDCGYGFAPLKVAMELLDNLSQVIEIAKELQTCCDNMGLNNEEDPAITNRARSASVQLNQFLTNLPE